jgi:hypothetical protein
MVRRHLFCADTAFLHETVHEFFNRIIIKAMELIVPVPAIERKQPGGRLIEYFPSFVGERELSINGSRIMMVPDARIVRA